MRGWLMASAGMLLFASAPAQAQAQWQWPDMVGLGTRTAMADGAELARVSGHAIYDGTGEAREDVGPLYYYVNSIMTSDRWFIGDVVLNNPTDVDYCYTPIGKVWHRHRSNNGTPIDIKFTTTIGAMNPSSGQQYIRPHSWVVQFRGIDDGNRWFYPQEKASFQLGWIIAYAIWPRDVAAPLAQSCETNRPDQYDAWVKSDVDGPLHSLILR